MKCPICQTRHRLGDPHVWTTADRPRHEAVRAEVRNETTMTAASELAALKAKIAERKAKSAAYMRGYRSRLKGQKK